MNHKTGDDRDRALNNQQNRKNPEQNLGSQQGIENQEQTRFDRAHFKEYGAYALNFETVYWIENPDYNIYMDIQQTINLEIFQQFESEDIEFAYPSQSIYLNDVSSSVKAAFNL